MQAFDGVGIDTLQDIFKVHPGIDLVLTAGSSECHQGRGGMPAGLAADKKPVFAAKRDRPNGVLREIVIDRDAAVQKICLELLPDTQRIADRLAHG